MRTLTDREFALFQRFIFEAAGIMLSTAKKPMVRGRLAKRLPVDSDIARVVERIDEDYDLKPAGGAAAPAHDADGVVIEPPAERPPAKPRGAAAW